MVASKHRFFIALLPPSEVQTYANQVKQYFAEQYQSRAALKSPPHVTLLPPFEWPLATLSEVHNCLQEFAAARSPVPVSLSGFGAFPPRVIYIKVVKSPALLTLQQDLALTCAERLGLTAQNPNRPFAPHLTVAFRDLSRQNFHAAWPEFVDRPVQFDFIVPHLTLLIHDGQRWLVHSEYGYKG